MSSYKFKSVGKTASVIETEKVLVTRTPVGIKTPLRLDEKNIFAMHYSFADQIHDNLRNLLLTNWGERLGLYEFGANLKELTSEYTDIETFDDEAITRIRNAVSKWMPFVSLQNFASSIDREENRHVGILKIIITYNVNELGIKDKALQISMYVT
jgi:phage baseplate assembly protein W